MLQSSLYSKRTESPAQFQNAIFVYPEYFFDPFGMFLFDPEKICHCSRHDWRFDIRSAIFYSWDLLGMQRSFMPSGCICFTVHFQNGYWKTLLTQVLGGSLQRRALRATDTYWTPAVKGSQCQLAEKLPHRMLCQDFCSSLILNLHEIYFWTWIVCIFQGLVTTGQGQQASFGWVSTRFFATIFKSYPQYSMIIFWKDAVLSASVARADRKSVV